MGMIRSFVEDAKRIFTVSRKPDLPEFKTIAKVTGIGIIIIALIGFIVRLLVELLKLF
jgi:protein transport protein SEC61 subunit gamma and related proteins